MAATRTESSLMATSNVDTKTAAVWTIAAILGLTLFAPGLYLPVRGILDAPRSVAVAVYSGALNGLLAGVVIGIGQYFALSGKSPSGRTWIGITILGATIGGAIVGPLQEDLHRELRTIPTFGVPGMWMWVLSIAVWGACIASGQFLVLRRYAPRAGWWVMIASGTWVPATGTAFWLHDMFVNPLEATALDDYLWMIIPTGVIVGILQSAALCRLLPPR